MSIVTDFTTRGKKSCEYMSDKEKYIILIPHLISSPIGKDLHDGAVAFFCQTGKQLIDLMEDATGVDAMTKLCEARLNPLSYQRPTAEASVGQISEAIEHLGDFKNTVMTLKDLLTYHPNTVSIQGQSIGSSMDGFAKQMATALTFAQKVEAKTFAEKSKYLKLDTIADLIELAKSGNVDIEIMNELTPAMYLATTTLAAEKRSVPHFWAFTHKSLDASFGIKQQWVRVSHIVPLWKNIKATPWKNVLFVLNGVKAIDFGNCCFPEFLSSEYSRTCRTAFEGLNKVVKVIVPDEPIVAGYGVSVKDEKMNLMHDIMVRVNGIVKRISRME
jgi:hypothetical protein